MKKSEFIDLLEEHLENGTDANKLLVFLGAIRMEPPKRALTDDECCGIFSNDGLIPKEYRTKVNKWDPE